MTQFDVGGRTFDAELSGDMLTIRSSPGVDVSVFVGVLPPPTPERVFVPQGSPVVSVDSEESL